MRRFRLVAVAALVALSLTMDASPAAAQSASVAEVGWWTRNPAASAPEGGLDVGAAPDGAMSVGAIGVTGTGSVRKALLFFSETGGVQQDGAALQVCSTPNTWKAGAAQPFAEAPQAECDTSGVELKRNASTSSWSADVTTFLFDLEDEGRVDLMIVPDGTGTVPLGFDVKLGAPQLQVEFDEESSSSSSDFDSPTLGGSFDEGGSDDFSGNGDDTSGDFSSSSAPFDSAAVPATDAGVPAVPGTADGTVGTTTGPATAATDAAGAGDNAELAALPTQSSTGAGAGGGNRTLQAIFFVVVATIAGVGAGLVRWFVGQRSGDDGAFA